MGEGRKISQRAAEKIRQLDRDNRAKRDLTGVTVGRNQQGNQCITAQLLARVAPEAPTYTWRQERRTASGWEEVTGGLTDHSGKFPAHDLNEENDNNLAGNHVVLVRTTINSSNEVGWVIVGSAGDGITGDYDFATRVEYDGTTLSYFKRTLTFENGRVTEITGETEVIIDTTVDCTGE